MIRRTLLVTLLALVLGAFGIASARATTARADQELAIRKQCTEIDVTLDRVYANDALTRVNQGRSYDALSSSLMQPLNARVSLNGGEASGLVATTNSYQEQVNVFRKTYQKYERLLTALREIDCARQPSAFYDQLMAVRAARADVRAVTLAIKKIVDNYRAQVVQLQKQEAAQ